jgi:hypothetical protein
MQYAACPLKTKREKTRKTQELTRKTKQEKLRS